MSKTITYTITLALPEQAYDDTDEEVAKALCKLAETLDSKPRKRMAVKDRRGKSIGNLVIDA